MKKTKADLIIDIGKSNIKFLIFKKNNGLILKKKVFINNFLIKKKSYSELDHQRLIDLIKKNIKSNINDFDLKSILPITHGSVSFLLDKNYEVLKSISDESKLDKKFNKKFENKIKKIKNSYSPNLDYCHNLSKSLFYIKENYNKVYNKNKILLLYPNFISYKLSGKISADLSYLSNHSFLWDFKKQKINSFAKFLNLDKSLPNLNKNNNELGKLLLNYSLNKDVSIFSGKHDSSCCYYFHKKKFKKNFALLSTGTWMIIYNENGKLNQEKIKKDTHLSHSIDNKVIAVARYPGGHEFKLLNKKVKEHPSININTINEIIKNKDLILPSFYKGGAFKDKIGKVIINRKINKRSNTYKYHLNMLYISFMTFYSLNLLSRKKIPIIIDGVFSKNKFFTQFISCLSDYRKVYISRDENGVARGGYLIINKSMKLKNDYIEIEKDKRVLKLVSNYYKFWKKNLPIN